MRSRQVKSALSAKKQQRQARWERALLKINRTLGKAHHHWFLRLFFPSLWLRRLQRPAGIRIFLLLLLAWLMTLLLIWGATREILSLGHEILPSRNLPQTMAQRDHQNFLHLIGAIGLGCVGLSFLITPSLRHSPTALRSSDGAIETPNPSDIARPE
ncbi:hypothetical protein [Alkalinema sp. FACHB-956]|uniref:hypothetical protein n=1 Tax=Alkalinema sp. FACHB-956 TaxID=2692768 RepID=UPI001685DC80|nr:hypothetical protein [Alkalinema sp. FACHB-956]MBD2330105.1 hypothetical protein [Alkalinema sp. FACHB-956]